ncbi:DHA1 family bicyclomycin/chloramphenicol resistance-like MFS transporter [Thermocatellispora tengchongensis]|uniref:DHA1 family bicyclomycin/chloramphenicol resistance-like MFS transporter n=1 Tax=Thermocatellispora tengchongensis TaxID=1073253 RepID=A0A840PHI2_9ACTN|nr:multidrug effflux MFS transporter [Thermocatellispora tengchongensis]MBB5136587.1 DHA1 family bicyclomycin/chloramphenicol resistance-like MFS transporter [Thermocatellispora tengchongensis]
MTADGRTRDRSPALLLGALVALAPLSIDAYLPALPRLAGDLDAAPSAVQLTVTACLVGLACGQLLAGPLSDAWGRRRPLLIGLGVHTVAGLLCAVAPDAASLVVFRALQGMGGAFGLVIAYACVRDRYTGTAAARVFSSLMLVSGLAPVLAPLAGAQVLRFGDWRTVFLGLALLSGVTLAGCAVALPESLPPERRRRAAGVAYPALLRDRALLGYALANALVFGAMFVYIAGSPFVLQQIHGLSPQQYGVVFAVNAFGLVAATHVNGRLVRRFHPRKLLGAGVAGSAAGGAALLVVVLADAGLWPLLTALLIVVTSVGLVLPNAPALALHDHGAHAGAAAALLGFAQFFVGGLAAPLAGADGAGSALPMAVAVAVLGLAAALTFLMLRRRRTGPSRTRRLTSDDQEVQEMPWRRSHSMSRGLGS